MAIRPGNLGYDRAVGCIFGTLNQSPSGWTISTGPVTFPVRLTRNMQRWAEAHQSQLGTLHEVVVWPRQSRHIPGRLLLTVVAALQWGDAVEHPRDSYEVVGEVTQIGEALEGGNVPITATVQPVEESAKPFSFTLLLHPRARLPQIGTRYQFACLRRKGGLFVTRYRDAGPRIAEERA